MKQISKKDLINLIMESSQNTELDEMAEITGANPWDANYNPKKERKTQVKLRYFARQHGMTYKQTGAADVFIYNILPKGEKIMTVKGEEQGRGVDEEGNPKNYKFIVVAHDGLPTISNDSQEQSDFEKRFNNWLESMKNEGYRVIYDGALKVKDDPIGIGRSDFRKSTKEDGTEDVQDVRKLNKFYYQMRQKFGVILDEKTGVVNSVSENINIILMKDIRSVMDEQEFVDHLGSAGIPYVNTPQNLVYPTHTKRCHGTDVYGSRTNEKIRWASNSVMEPFKNLDEYISYIDLLIENKADKRDTKYNKRQYQSGPRKGMMQHGDAIYVSNLFDVLGESDGNGNFIWKLSFKGLVGSNFKNGDWMDNLGLRPFVHVKSERIAKSTEMPKNGCILSNLEVHSALIDALNEIKSQLLNVKLDKLIDESNTSVRGFFDLFTMEGEDYSKEPQTEPQGDTETEPEMEPAVAEPLAPKAKKVKKITKEAIEAMVFNVIKESIK
jgi:hypothetical protein